MTEEEKIFAGTLYTPGDPALKEKKRKAHNLSIDYNRLHEDETKERERILDELLGYKGKGVFLQGPITFHYGVHTSIGDGTFINFNFTVQDDAKVTIGRNCNFGPNVTIVTPIHPLVASERYLMYNEKGEKKHMCYAKPVVIGDDCWICANVVINPGVTIGRNCVIASGSVVTRDIPDNSLAMGVPCRVVRTITREHDSMTNYPEILGDNAVIEPED